MSSGWDPSSPEKTEAQQFVPDSRSRECKQTPVTHANRLPGWRTLVWASERGVAEGLWDCESGVELGLAQRADEDPVGLVQSSDMFSCFGRMCMYICMYPRHQQDRQSASPDDKLKTGEDSWRLEGRRSSGEDTAGNKRGKGRRGVRACCARVSGPPSDS